MLLLRLKHPDNARWQGHTLAEIAADRGQDPLDTALDILASERTTVFTAFHSMSEDNLRRQLSVPWVGVCSDAASIAPAGRSLDSPTHPRAYGSFARVLGHYTRELGVLTLPEAVRRMTSLPAYDVRPDRPRCARAWIRRRPRRPRPRHGHRPGDVRRPAPALGRASATWW